MNSVIYIMCILQSIQSIYSQFPRSLELINPNTGTSALYDTSLKADGILDIRQSVCFQLRVRKHLSSEISGRKYSLTTPHKTQVILKPNGLCRMLFSIKPALSSIIQFEKQLSKVNFFLATELCFLRLFLIPATKLLKFEKDGQTILLLRPRTCSVQGRNFITGTQSNKFSPNVGSPVEDCLLKNKEIMLWSIKKTYSFLYVTSTKISQYIRPQYSKSLLYHGFL